MKLIIIFLLLFSGLQVFAQDNLSYTQTEIIYGRKDGMALTMLKLSPKKNSNGKAIISVLNGNWVSAYRMMEAFPGRVDFYLDAGYTVFGVLVSSQPQYSIPDEVADLKRAVRFVRYNAGDYKIDPNHIGITGSSSGGHLSLMVSLADDAVDKNSKDPVERQSARVQAVAVFYPPTDFINFGRVNAAGTINQAALVFTGVAAAFDFKEWNEKTKTFVPVTDTEKRLQIARENSPITLVSADDPPVFIIHGDKDMLVPMQQAEVIMTKLQEFGVTHQLLIKAGGAHGWPNRDVEEKNFITWFDKYLK